MVDTVFSIQDETGTVAQLTIVNISPGITVSVGDEGTYTGIPDDGTDGWQIPPSASCPFTVVQTLNFTQFSINTTVQNLADWPRSGQIVWSTGANAGQTTTVTKVDGANSYMSEAEYMSYWASRGVDQSTVSATALQGALVQATDYIDQRYTFAGTKLVQKYGAAPIDANAVFLQPWLFPGSILNVMNPLTPASSSQSTQWPRQGVVDRNGLNVNGIPNPLKQAVAELAYRVLNGTVLQPDYDPTVVTNGAVVQSISKEVGPLKKTVTYDTKMGLGFFPDFPHVTRILRSAGLLKAGGRRTVMR